MVFDRFERFTFFKPPALPQVLDYIFMALASLPATNDLFKAQTTEEFTLNIVPVYPG